MLQAKSWSDVLIIKVGYQCKYVHKYRFLVFLFAVTIKTQIVNSYSVVPVNSLFFSIMA